MPPVEALLEAVRQIRGTAPDLGVKPLLSKLRAQQPDLRVGSKEVRKALKALKAENEAKAAAAPPDADEGGTLSPAVLRLACGGAGLLSDVDDREKLPPSTCRVSSRSKRVDTLSPQRRSTAATMHPGLVALLLAAAAAPPADSPSDELSSRGPVP